MPHQVYTILGFAELTAQPPWMLAFSSQCITNHDDLCLGRKNVPANGQFLDMRYILVSLIAIGNRPLCFLVVFSGALSHLPCGTSLQFSFHELHA